MQVVHPLVRLISVLQSKEEKVHSEALAPVIFSDKIVGLWPKESTSSDRIH